MDRPDHEPTPVITGADGVVHLMMVNRRLLCDGHDYRTAAATRTPRKVTPTQALIYGLPSCSVCFFGQKVKFHEQ
jgi:hypothetical protein